MAKKIRVGILFGGRSTEHEVSIRSAKNVFDVIDRKKFAPILIGIDKQGTWLTEEESKILLATGKSPKKKQDLMPKLDLKKPQTPKSPSFLLLSDRKALLNPPRSTSRKSNDRYAVKPGNE